MNKISEIGLLLTAPGKATKSIGFPTKRTSAGLQGKSGKKGATCSSICPLKTALERLTASFLSDFEDFFITKRAVINQRKKTKRARINIKKIKRGEACKK